MHIQFGSKPRLKSVIYEYIGVATGNFPATPIVIVLPLHRASSRADNPALKPCAWKLQYEH